VLPPGLLVRGGISARVYAGTAADGSCQHFMPIGQLTSLEELFKAAAIELDELKAARFHNFAVAAFAGLGLYWVTCSSLLLMSTSE
jgi:hypothetical protein